MPTRDPLADLAHDHADLNRRVLALSAQLSTTRTAEGASARDVGRALDELRDLLFLHFAREEEGLFPYVTEIAPDLAPQVHAMLVAHDTICGALARMCQLSAVEAPRSSVVTLFERFEVAYVEHARTEGELLERLAQRLDHDQRQALAALVAGL